MEQEDFASSACGKPVFLRPTAGRHRCLLYEEIIRDEKKKSCKIMSSEGR